MRLTRTDARRWLPAAVVLVAACNPASSRPGFLPYPEDASVLLTGAVPAIASAVGAWFESQGIHLEWSNAGDGYVETTWYDTDTHQVTSGTGDLGTMMATFKLRVWVDPDAPGKSKMTVEAVYRPTLDPSRMERDLERSAPPGSGGAVLLQSLMAEMQSKFGGS
ncbi:MAG TPA: hypothetical protein VH113_06940 [Gemmatimonadales bacterium]|jgi:hypothetical protein|nr:hypothetical protein [Gemmatimonadales bacterium]